MVFMSRAGFEPATPCLKVRLKPLPDGRFNDLTVARVRKTPQKNEQFAPRAHPKLIGPAHWFRRAKPSGTTTNSPQLKPMNSGAYGFRFGFDLGLFCWRTGTKPAQTIRS